MRLPTTNNLETPALLVDLESMEANMDRMATILRGRPAKLRPHFKSHQVVCLASKQMGAGAIGITCARLAHAEALAHHGIKSILIAKQIVGERAIRRLVKLSRHTEIIVAVDNAKVVCDMARVAGDQRSALNIVVELDIGLARCGVLPGQAALSLTKTVLQQGLRFRGLMAHRGQFRLPDTREKHLLVCSAIQSVIDSKNLIEREGIPSELVSSGGTSDCAIVGAFPGVTEIQAGSYLLMDSWYVPFAPDFKPGLTVLTTVISCNPGRIVVDAGAKAMSAQKGLPMVKGFGGLRVKALHAEHAIIEILEPQAGVEVGDKLEIWVQHLDSTVSLHKRMYGIRKGKVEEVFQIEC